MGVGTSFVGDARTDLCGDGWRWGRICVPINQSINGLFCIAGKGWINTFKYNKIHCEAKKLHPFYFNFIFLMTLSNRVLFR